MPTCEPVCWLEFQSTLSVRRATNPPKTLAENHIISIHALRKESDLHQRLSHQLLHISIHALRKESDPVCRTILAAFHVFQSTLSVRRATPSKTCSTK